MDLNQITKNFLDELHIGDGRTTSIEFIHNPLPDHHMVPDNELYQVIVIGGSVFRKATVKKENRKVEIVSLTTEDQPSFPTAESLFLFLEKHVDPSVRFVACNFAYPLLPEGRDGVLDGVLLSGSKENDFTGLTGKLVGQEIESYFRSKRQQQLHVTLANDTVCLVMSGLTKYAAASLGGGVDGTGLNFAFFLSDRDVINLEAGSFDKFNQSTAGRYIDAASLIPRHHLLEKEVSGAYLYQHYNYAALDRRNLDRISSTKELDTIAQESTHPGSALAQSLLKQSADLVACVIAAILLYKKQDMTFVMQGSLFWKGLGYKERVIETCHILCQSFRPTFVEIENADIYGAAELF